MVLASYAATAADKTFHDAPASVKSVKNPFAGQAAAIKAGGEIFSTRCSKCHGQQGRGTGNIPALTKSSTQSASDGELFWFITTGSVNDGMPAWEKLPEKQRWQIVAFIKTMHGSAGSAAISHAPPATVSKASSPFAPFTDYRYEKPGTVRKITVSDLPAPYATKSSGNGPRLVARPANAWPQAPAGFKVEQYAVGLDGPCLIRTAPNGDSFVAETARGDIKVLRGISSAGKAEQVEVFTQGLNQPYGIAFYPPGPDPQWVYVGNTDSVVRIPYQNGDMKARGPVAHIAGLPSGEGHWTRDIQFSLDGKRMFVAVGSGSDVDDPDDHPQEKDRGDILVFNPDGSGKKIFAYGIRNAGGGLAIQPETGELWCSVNERDDLGDNLVPDYITHVREGGFYGWPWWYIGGHQDPRHADKHPELKDKVITPDVLLQPHNASLQPVFYEGKQFPAEYRGDIFAAEHGSWNKSVRAGYEVIRVPLHQTGHASGEYEDFLTGFVVDDTHVWGRPVGVAVALDGSLLVSDDWSNTVWRMSYTGK